MSVFISETDRLAMAKSFAKRQQAAEEGGYSGFVSAEHKREFEERVRYHNLGYSNVFTGERMSKDDPCGMNEKIRNARAAQQQAHLASQSEPQMYTPPGAQNVYPNQPNLEDAVTLRHISPWLNAPSLATPLVDQYLPTFAFTAEERKQIEELLRKGLRG